MRAAVGAAVLCVMRRVTHSYGDPLPWKRWPTVTPTMMDFFGVQRYGPSLQVTLITVALAFALLG